MASDVSVSRARTAMASYAASYRSFTHAVCPLTSDRSDFGVACPLYLEPQFQAH